MSGKPPGGGRRFPDGFVWGVAAAAHRAEA